MEGRVWQQLRSLGDDLRLAEVLTATGCFLRYLQSGGWDRLSTEPHEIVEAEIAREIRKSPEGRSGFPREVPSGTAPLLRTVADLAAAQGEAALFEFFVARFLEAHQRSFAATPEPLAGLMTRLAGERARTVFDPACGTGTLLLASSEGRRLFGQELDPDLVRLAAVRLSLTTDQAELRHGDALRADAFPDTSVDAVVCNPPFNDRDWGHDELSADPRWEYGLPPRMESELAWVQHTLAHVRPGGTVVILMPVAAASRRSGRRLRGELLRKGALRAVVDVPPAMASAAGIPAHLWLLKRPTPGGQTPSAVLFAETDPDDVDAIVEAWTAFQAGSKPATGRVVPLLDLLDDEVDLTPARHLADTATTGDMARLRSEVEARLAAIQRLLPASVEPSPPVKFSMTTVADLAGAGVLVVARAGKSGPPPHVEPGDLIVTPGGERLHVRVVGVAPVVLEPNQQLVRVNPAVMDAQFLAGFLRGSHNHHPGGGSTSPGRKDVRRAAVPRPPKLADQRVYGEAFQRMEEFTNHLHEAAREGELLARMLVDGFTEGRLLVSREKA